MTVLCLLLTVFSGDCVVFAVDCSLLVTVFLFAVDCSLLVTVLCLRLTVFAGDCVVFAVDCVNMDQLFLCGLVIILCLELE